MIAFDSETTGVDLRHGAAPFFVSYCDDPTDPRGLEWDVDPLTRRVNVPPADVAKVQALLDDADVLVAQNAKFDVTALSTIGVRWGKEHWAKLQDTLIASHILASNQPHSLDALVLHYLGEDIRPLEERLKQACMEARRMVQQARLRVKRAKAVDAGKLPPGPVDMASYAIGLPTFGHESEEPLAAWRIAEEGLPEMPSARGGQHKEERGVESQSPWKHDTWLPRALAMELSYREPAEDCQHEWDGNRCRKCRGHHWFVVLREYALADAMVTHALWPVMEAELRHRDMWEIYLERMKVVPVVHDMERRGVTISGARLEELETTFREESERAGALCRGIALSKGYDLTLPKSGNNGSLTRFCFGHTYLKCEVCEHEQPSTDWDDDYPARTAVMPCPKCVEAGANGQAGRLLFHKDRWLDLPILKESRKTGAPSLDKYVLEEYEATLPPNSKQLTFARALQGKRKRDTALQYMEGYRRFWVPLGVRDWFRLYPSLNITGTDTLRMSSSNPNAQNVSKQEDFTLRYAFGPAPGREWWDLDFVNVELILPSFASGEQAMMDLFLKPDEPPYFGSYHLLNASIIYPDLFWPLAEQEGAFKKKYKSTWYQWCKNASFALIYGCQEAKFDATAHKRGGYAQLRAKMPNLFKYADKWIAFANKHGYVETLPDKTVNPRRGYPLMCTRLEYGKVSPTTPLNYHVSGSAMWGTMKAMNRIGPYLERVTADTGKDHYMTLQVHDSIVLDFPKGGKANLPKVRKVKQLMEESGRDFDIPLRVSVSYHPETWSEEVSFA